MALDDYVVTHDAGGSVVGQGILQESTVKNSPLGTKLVLNDGREFVYCLNGAVALTAGTLVQNQPMVATEDNLAINTATKGDMKVTVTTGSTITANQFAGGYLTIKDELGEGGIYKIKDHLAGTSGATSHIYNLYDPIRVTLTAATTYCLVPDPYSNVVVSVASGGTLTGSAIGGAIIPVTAAYYFWAQTKGVFNVLCVEGTAITVGDAVTTGSTAGSVVLLDVSSTADWPPIGVALMNGVNGEYTPIALRL